MTTSKESKFEEATYYNCYGDEEHLSCEEVEEAISRWLDDQVLSGIDDIGAFLKRHGPVKVEGYKRKEIDEKFVPNVAARMVELFTDEYNEEYGNFEDHEYDFRASELKELEQKISLLLQETLKGARCYQCEPCGEHSYSPEEAEQMMRKWCPHWFEADGKKD